MESLGCTPSLARPDMERWLEDERSAHKDRIGQETVGVSTTCRSVLKFQLGNAENHHPGEA